MMLVASCAWKIFLEKRDTCVCFSKKNFQEKWYFFHRPQVLYICCRRRKNANSSAQDRQQCVHIAKHFYPASHTVRCIYSAHAKSIFRLESALGKKKKKNKIKKKQVFRSSFCVWFHEINALLTERERQISSSLSLCIAAVRISWSTH